MHCGYALRHRVHGIYGALDQKHRKQVRVIGAWQAGPRMLTAFSGGRGGLSVVWWAPAVLTLAYVAWVSRASPAPATASCAYEWVSRASSGSNVEARLRRFLAAAWPDLDFFLACSETGRETDRETDRKSGRGSGRQVRVIGAWQPGAIVSAAVVLLRYTTPYRRYTILLLRCTKPYRYHHTWYGRWLPTIAGLVFVWGQGILSTSQPLNLSTSPPCSCGQRGRHIA